MKNTSKDRYEHKLQQFLKDISVGSEHGICNFDDWLKLKEKMMKKYGFTDEDFYKACRLTRSGTDNPYKKFDNKVARLKKKKELHNKLNSGKQDHYDKVGEQEIKDEDDFLGDITDGFYISDWIDYDYEQDHNKKG